MVRRQSAFSVVRPKAMASSTEYCIIGGGVHVWYGQWISLNATWPVGFQFTPTIATGHLTIPADAQQPRPCTHSYCVCSGARIGPTVCDAWLPDCLNMCGPCEQYSSIPRLHKISFYLALCIAIRRFHGQTKPKSAHTQLAVGKRFCRTSLIYSHRHILLHCDIVLCQCSSNWSVLPAVHATAQLCHYYTRHVYCYPIQYLLHRQHQTVKEERTIGWQTNKKQTNKTKL